MSVQLLPQIWAYPDKERGKRARRMRMSNLTTNVFNQITSSLPHLNYWSVSIPGLPGRSVLSHPNPDWITSFSSHWSESPGGHAYDRRAPLLPAEAGPGPRILWRSSWKGQQWRAWRQLTWREKNNIPLTNRYETGLIRRSCCLYSAF